MFQIIFYHIAILLSGKNYLSLKDKIKITDNKLTSSLKYNKLKDIIRNNLDIKTIIIKLFYWSFLINLVFYVLAVLISIFYNVVFIHDFSGAKILGTKKLELSQKGVWVTNIIVIIFLLRVITASYKLAYRSHYHKIIFLDILTCNILSIIGILIFNKNKNQMLPHHDVQINNSNLNSQMIKNYLKLLWKIELFMFLMIIALFILDFILIYFVSNNIIKNIGLILIIFIMLIYYLHVLPKFISMTIFQRMFHNLLKNQSLAYLLSIIRFLIYTRGLYYTAVLIHLFEFEQDYFVDTLIKKL